MYNNFRCSHCSRCICCVQLKGIWVAYAFALEIWLHKALATMHYLLSIEIRALHLCMLVHSDKLSGNGSCSVKAQAITQHQVALLLVSAFIHDMHCVQQGLCNSQTMCMFRVNTRTLYAVHRQTCSEAILAGLVTVYTLLFYPLSSDVQHAFVTPVATVSTVAIHSIELPCIQTWPLFMHTSWIHKHSVLPLATAYLHHISSTSRTYTPFI
jgi:hypothetical protein